LGTLWPAGAEALWTLAAGGAHLVLLIARAADALPGSRIAVPEGAPGALLAVAVLLVAAIAVAAPRPPLPRWAVAGPPGGGARAADALPGSRIAVPEGAPGALLAVAVLLVAAIAVAARRLPLTRWAVAALLVAALTPGAVRLLPVAAGTQWTVAMCAVGQGDA